MLKQVKCVLKTRIQFLMVASEISMVRSPLSVASPYFSKVESRSLWDEVPETVPDVSKVYKSRECQGKNRDFTPEKWDFNWVSLKISPKAKCESSFSLWNGLLPLGPHFQTHPTKKTRWIRVIWMAKDWTSGRKTGISIHKLRGISPWGDGFQPALRLVQVEISRAGVRGGFWENFPHSSGRFYSKNDDLRVFLCCTLRGLL